MSNGCDAGVSIIGIRAARLVSNPIGDYRAMFFK
jgi:hypothetical protein